MELRKQEEEEKRKKQEKEVEELQKAAIKEVLLKKRPAVIAQLLSMNLEKTTNRELKDLMKNLGLNPEI